MGYCLWSRTKAHVMTVQEFLKAYSSAGDEKSPSCSLSLWNFFQVWRRKHLQCVYLDNDSYTDCQSTFLYPPISGLFLKEVNPTINARRLFFNSTVQAFLIIILDSNPYPKLKQTTANISNTISTPSFAIDFYGILSRSLHSASFNSFLNININ